WGLRKDDRVGAAGSSPTNVAAMHLQKYPPNGLKSCPPRFNTWRLPEPDRDKFRDWVANTARLPMSFASGALAPRSRALLKYFPRSARASCIIIRRNSECVVAPNKEELL